MIKKGKGWSGAFTVIPDVLLEKDDISDTAVRILAKVLNLWSNTGKVFISNERLMKLCGGASESKVQRAKRELVRLGLIKVSQEEKGKGHLASITVDERKVNAYLGYAYFPVVDEKAEADKNNTPQPPATGEWSWMTRMDKVRR